MLAVVVAPVDECCLVAPSCTVTESDALNPVISWANIAADATVVLRRNGGWIATPSPSASSYEDTAGLIQNNYVVRAWSADATFIDITCTR